MGSHYQEGLEKARGRQRAFGFGYACRPEVSVTCLTIMTRYIQISGHVPWLIFLCLRILLTAIEVYVRYAAEDIRNVKVVLEESSEKVEELANENNAFHEQAGEWNKDTASSISKVGEEVAKLKKDEQTKTQSRQFLLRIIVSID
jgi:hypothetical protein